MDAAALTRLRRGGRWALAALAAGITALLLAAWIGSAIPRNPGWREPVDGIEIMVGSNGVHTELVIPAVAPEKDWHRDFPLSDIADRTAPYTHVAISWGEREVFLNTPRWTDLRPATALRAMTGGAALLHVAHYIRPAPGPDNRPLRLTHAQYARLVAHIEAALPPMADRVRHPGYGPRDVFYDSRGRYDWRHTCNQWTSDALAAAGVRTGYWTPFAGGVMKGIPSYGG